MKESSNCVMNWSIANRRNNERSSNQQTFRRKNQKVHVRNGMTAKISLARAEWKNGIQKPDPRKIGQGFRNYTIQKSYLNKQIKPPWWIKTYYFHFISSWNTFIIENEGLINLQKQHHFLQRCCACWVRQQPFAAASD